MPVALKRREIHLDDEPFEEGEDLGEGVFARAVGQLGLVDGAVAEPEVDVLLGDALLAGVAEAVLVRVVEDRAFEGAEPAEFQDVAEIDVLGPPATVTVWMPKRLSSGLSQVTSW